MLKRIIIGLLFLLLVPSLASAQNQRAFGFCETGGVSITVQGLTQSAPPAVQASYPSCTVTVYLTGTLTLATLFSDTINTPLSNPFTANTLGYWFFYAANGRYDIKISGGGLSTPFTFGDVPLGQGAGGGAPSPPLSSLQYNNAGILGGTTGLLWNNGTNTLTAGTGAAITVSGTGKNTATNFTPFGTSGNCVSWGTSGVLADTGSPCGLVSSLTTGFLPKASSPTTLVNSLVSETVTPFLNVAEPLTLAGSFPYMIQRANSASGTTANLLVKINNSTQAITLTTSDTLNVFGICAFGCGTSGNSQIAIAGIATCLFDNQTVIRDWVVASSTLAGYCHDAGATEPNGVQNVARVDSVNSGGGTTASVTLFTPDISGATPTAGGQAPWNMLIPATLVLPVDASFSWVNQNGATTATDSTGLLVLSSASTGTNAEARVKTGTTATLGYVSAQDLGNQGLAGIILRESATGKLLSFSHGASAGGVDSVRTDRWTSPTSLAGLSALAYPIQGPLTYLRATNDGTNIHFWVSADGKNFLDVFDTTIAASFTTAPDQIGFFVSPGNNTFLPIIMSVFHWTSS